MLIMKCLVTVSREPSYCDFLLENYLDVSLQYVIRTDFQLWRKPLDSLHSLQSPSKSGVGAAASGSASGSPKKLNVTLSVILQGLNTPKSRKLEDINFKVARLVVLIYENALRLGVHVVGNIVSSGLITGFLFRVGRGKNIDKRFHKLLVHFVYTLMVKVAMETPIRPMAILDIVQPKAYTRVGQRRRPPSPPPSLKPINQKKEPVNVRTVTNKLHAQGVTELFVNCLDGEDYELVPYALIGLATMHFGTIRGVLMKESILGKISSYSIARKDCFF